MTREREDVASVVAEVVDHALVVPERLSEANAPHDDDADEHEASLSHMALGLRWPRRRGYKQKFEWKASDQRVIPPTANCETKDMSVKNLDELR